MQWVAKRHKIVAASLVVAIASFITFTSTVVLSVQKLVAKPIVISHCFETTTATTSELENLPCPTNYISLGDSLLLAQPETKGVVVAINPFLQNRFEAARITAKKEGIILYITSGFRSKERQMQLYKKEIVTRGSETEAAKWVLPPWYSNHPQGLAIDVNYPLDRPGAKWLEKNGSRFGLCRIYGNEWWHFEGVISPGGTCPALIPNAISNIDPSTLKLRADK